MLEHLIHTPRTLDLAPVVPHIRSSDDKFSDDFVYLLRRRYGLVKAGDYSEPLSLGAHWHALLEHSEDPDPMAFWPAYREGVIKEARPKDLETVSNDLDFAQGIWRDIVLAETISEDGETVQDYLKRPYMRTIASELTLRMGLPDGNISTIQIDRLRLNERTNSLTLVDLKSTSSPAQVRAAMCPFEFQTWHYLVTLSEALPALIDHFGLPPDVTVGGMDHLIFFKTKIRPSAQDRDFELEHKTITRGPRKGAVDTLRNYYGAPRWHNFVERAKAWYAENPGSVLVSTTHFSGNENLRAEYTVRLRALCERNLRAPDPSLHPRTERGATDWKGVSAYYPFYMSPDPSVWPVLAAQHSFTVEHRDPPMTLQPGEARIETP